MSSRSVNSGTVPGQPSKRLTGTKRGRPRQQWTAVKFISATQSCTMMNEINI